MWSSRERPKESVLLRNTNSNSVPKSSSWLPISVQLLKTTNGSKSTAVLPAETGLIKLTTRQLCKFGTPLPQASMVVSSSYHHLYMCLFISLKYIVWIPKWSDHFQPLDCLHRSFLGASRRESRHSTRAMPSDSKSCIWHTWGANTDTGNQNHWNFWGKKHKTQKARFYISQLKSKKKTHKINEPHWSQIGHIR